MGTWIVTKAKKMAKAEGPKKVRLTKRQLAILLRDVLSKEFEKELQTAASPFIKKAIKQGVEFGSRQLSLLSAQPGVGHGAIVTVGQKQINEITKRQIVRLSGEISRYTKVRLRSILGEGIEMGESIPELTDRVQNWAGEFGDTKRGTRTRARMIARTESARAVVEGQIESYETSSVVDRKEWVLAPESCEFCNALARKSKKIKVRDSFMKKGSVLKGEEGGVMKLDYSAIEGPPLHPNCRCALIPVLER
jgi:hypothetical protein